MPYSNSTGMGMSNFESSMEDALQQQSMSKLIFDNCVSQLIRTSINVAGIEDPMSRVLLHAENRHSIRAVDSNDVVPKLKSFSESFDNLWTESSLSSSSSSTKESVDSPTPDFPPVILVFDSLRTDMSDEGGIRESIDMLPRVSKMLYMKPKMELIDRDGHQNMSLPMENIERFSDLKPDAYGNALGILQRLREDAYQIDAKEYVYKITTSSKSEYSSNGEVVEDVDRQDEHENYTTSFKLDRILKKKMTIEKGKVTDECGKIQMNKPIIKYNDDDQKEISLNDILEEILNSMKQGETAPKNSPIGGTETSCIKLEKPIRDADEDDETSEGMMTILPDQKDLNFKASKETFISKIMEKTLIENEKGKSMKPIEVPLRRRCKNSKGIHRIGEYHAQNVIKERPQILCKTTFPANNFKVPWHTLVRDGDVVIFGKKLIVDLNDIVESISTSIVLRDLGVVKLPERVLISNAAAFVKLKSERLTEYIYKKYRILRGSMKTSSFEGEYKTQQQPNPGSLVPSLFSNLKTSSNLLHSMNWNYERNSAKQPIFQLKSIYTDSTTRGSSLDSLKKSIKGLSNIE